MKGVLDLLDRAAERFPDRVAAADRETQMTFSELKERAEHIAAVLSREADLLGRPVGVMADRSAGVPLLCLAAAAAGAWYIPVDPDLPPEKLAAVLEDAQPAAVLGAETFRERLAAVSPETPYRTAEELLAVPAGAHTVPEAGPDTPLYMIYTSGSTGKPKGVLKSHGAVLSFLSAYTERFDFSETDVIGNQTPFFFDASAKDFYLMLAAGARLEVIPSGLFAVPTDLIEYLNEKRVTFLPWVPTVLSIVSKLKVLSFVKPETVRRVAFVGEAMPVKHLNRWREALPQVQFVNLYGATELAGVCSAFEVAGAFADDETLPLGTPLSNCRLALMKDGEPVTKPGITGELWLQSPALALEYYHDPDRTAASFFTADLGGGPARTFRTGDLAQFDAAGRLKFVSRKDSQFKHMGYRIEAGEIETVAGALPEIARCCCLYDEAKLRILLYAELAEGVQTTGKELQQQLKTKLSSYMVPGRVVILPELPVSANGKIDRQKLKSLI